MDYELQDKIVFESLGNPILLIFSVKKFTFNPYDMSVNLNEQFFEVTFHRVS